MRTVEPLESDMAHAAHLATITAYPIDATKGGGFRGVLFIRNTKERSASERFDTLEQAKHWAKVQAENAYAARGYSLASVRRKGEYLANVWVRVEN